MYLDTVKNDVDYNRKIFLNYISSIKKIDNLYLRCILAKKAARFATTHSTGIYSSYIIEQCFLDLATTIKTDLVDDYNKNTVLHVMTEAYDSGGHTRCVERWVNIVENKHHDCIVLSQGVKLPNSLMEAFNKIGGNVYLCKKFFYIDKALELRRLASKYEIIVLHIHMDDPTALIAFGTHDFKRPIIFFNHADHIFWLGVTIADCVANLNSIGNRICINKRNIRTSHVLGIPIDNLNFKIHLKENLNNKIFISGLSTKFRPVDHIDFYHIISDIIQNYNKAVFVIVGANLKDSVWKKVKKDFPHKVQFLQTKTYKEYLNILSESSLVLDSYPVGGGTALLDAISCGIPVLSLNKDFQMDYIVNSKACFCDYNIFINTVVECLKNNNKRKELYKDLINNFNISSSVDIWLANYYRIEKDILGKEHEINYFYKENIIDFNKDNLAFKIANWVDHARFLKKFKQRANNLFSLSIKKGYVFIFLLNKPYIFSMNKKTFKQVRF